MSSDRYQLMVNLILAVGAVAGIFYFLTSASDQQRVDMILTAGFGAGLYFFYKGWRIFREYHVLIDTPEAPISGVAMGLVAIHGQAKIDQPVLSPVTRTPCCFYIVDIFAYVKNKGGTGYFVHCATDADGPKFYLQDASGRVLVDAHHVEHDLQPTGGVIAEFDKPAKWLVVKDASGKVLEDDADWKLAENDWQPTAKVMMEGEQRWKRGRGSHRTTGSGALDPKLQLGSDLFAYADGARQRNKGTPISHRYRLHEFLIVPDHWYDLTGTCVENPTPQDANDRNMIKKGTEEPTFLITWRGEKEMGKTLRHRAEKYIFGGGTLAVACLGIFLAIHDWLT